MSTRPSNQAAAVASSCMSDHEPKFVDEELRPRELVDAVDSFVDSLVIVTSIRFAPIVSALVIAQTLIGHIPVGQRVMSLT